MFTCFFFSSRRRHTRSKRDWSSDVCSSDLPLPAPSGRKNGMPLPAPASLRVLEGTGAVFQPSGETRELVTPTGAAILAVEIGRASCRERCRWWGWEDGGNKKVEG